MNRVDVPGPSEAREVRLALIERARREQELRDAEIRRKDAESAEAALLRFAIFVRETGEHDWATAMRHGSGSAIGYLTLGTADIVLTRLVDAGWKQTKLIHAAKGPETWGYEWSVNVRP